VFELPIQTMFGGLIHNTLPHAMDCSWYHNGQLMVMKPSLGWRHGRMAATLKDPTVGAAREYEVQILWLRMDGGLAFHCD
jgi:hypothetical protein